MVRKQTNTLFFSFFNIEKNRVMLLLPMETRTVLIRTPGISSMRIMGIFILFCLFFPVVAAGEKCPVSFCGNNGIPVRFPFRLPDVQPENCGYPGFYLGCSNDSRIVLSLPASGDFFVRSIDYHAQEIALYDARNCLLRRRLSLDLSDSPFHASYPQNFTFLSCPTKDVVNGSTALDCLSNSTYKVFATSSTSVVKSFPNNCQRITGTEIPASWSFPYKDDDPADVLEQDIFLTWYHPNCEFCEANGTFCGFTSNDSQEIGCFPDQNSGISNIGLRVFRISCLTFAAVALSLATGMMLFTYLERRHDYGGHLPPGSINTSIPAPRPTTTTVGLDESTIESYEKVVLDEGRRLPGLNGSTCSICLSEYKSKETLRCVPKCQHCFHATCVDEWLRLNGTCPLCRNTPSPVNLHNV